MYNHININQPNLKSHKVLFVFSIILCINTTFSIIIFKFFDEINNMILIDKDGNEYTLSSKCLIFSLISFIINLLLLIVSSFYCGCFYCCKSITNENITNENITNKYYK